MTPYVLTKRKRPKSETNSTPSLQGFGLPESAMGFAVVWPAAAGRNVIMPRPDAAAEVAADAAIMAAFTPPSFTAGRSCGGR